MVVGAEEGVRPTGLGLKVIVSHLLLVLGTELGSSATAASVPSG